MKTNKLKDETKNYLTFANIVLDQILGYPIDDIVHHNDNVEFQFRGTDGDRILCVEAKGTSTKDLFAPQHRTNDHRSPIQQTWGYMGSINLEYGICTNYRLFVLITKERGTSRYHKFDFATIAEDEEKIKEFIGIFSKKSIIDDGFVEKLEKESIVEEREFTKEFYKLFHETRLMMIKSFQKNGVARDNAVRYAQLYLNRLIFMFFAQDHGFIEKKLFTARVSKTLNSSLVSDHSNMVSNEILGLFRAMDAGSNSPNIFGFNGGLFEEDIPPTVFFSDFVDVSFFDDVRQNTKLKIKLNEITASVINKHENKLNPIIVNLLMMDSFDFTTEVNVNILGHVFEQSISDLEELRNEKISKRKVEGVYYTPEYITDYICRNTIIPYLSKSNAKSVSDLIKEYENNLDELEERFKAIKILDPACGSGAFLVKAVDILLEIHKEIQIVKESKGKYTEGDQFKLTKWNEETEARTFVKNNVYGVDINLESVEITKLSLFLKIASKRQKLVNLSNNIKFGNSLIDDKNVDERYFDWTANFSNVMNLGKFDIVVGNPPYIPIELMEDIEKNFYSNQFEGIFRKYDTSVLFIENCLKYLKHEGYLGFIVPLTWQTGGNYQKFREIIFKGEKIRLANLINLPFDVFQDPYVDTGIVIFKKTQKLSSFYAYQYPKNEKINSINDNLGEIIKFERILEQPDLKVVLSNIIYDRLSKTNKNFELLGTITKSTQGIVTSKYDISDTKKSPTHLPFLMKADANRYRFQIRTKKFIDSSKISNIVNLYIQPKILIRRIINRQNRLMAFYDNTGMITNKDYNPFKIISDDYDIFYILGLLNSKFFSYLYYFKSSIAQKNDYRQTTLSEIRTLPIIRTDKTKSKEISAKAKKLAQLTNQYFEKKDEILRRVSGTFHIVVNTKISNIIKIEFEEFKQGIESLAIKKLSLDEQDKWDRYFQRHKSGLIVLANNIESVENELDELVYALYDVTEKERQLIEQNILKYPF